MTAVHWPFWQAQYPCPQSIVKGVQSASHPPPQIGDCPKGTQARASQQVAGTQSESCVHGGQVPQSATHVPQFSPTLQTPSPQTRHWPQSLVQLLQVSVPLQVPSPQMGGQAPQSAEQVLQVSVLLQVPSPQMGGQAPQSAEQVLQVSVPLQTRSPQTGGQTPQSAAQVLQVSVPLQLRSPQTGGQAPQSEGQVVQVSVPLQTPFPQPRALAADSRASIFSLTGEILAVTASGVFGVCAPAELTPTTARMTTPAKATPSPRPSLVAFSACRTIGLQADITTNEHPCSFPRFIASSLSSEKLRSIG